MKWWYCVEWLKERARGLCNWPDWQCCALTSLFVRYSSNTVIPLSVMSLPEVWKIKTTQLWSQLWSLQTDLSHCSSDFLREKIFKSFYVKLKTRGSWVRFRAQYVKRFWDFIINPQCNGRLVMQIYLTWNGLLTWKHQWNRYRWNITGSIVCLTDTHLFPGVLWMSFVIPGRINPGCYCWLSVQKAMWAIKHCLVMGTRPHPLQVGI